MRSNDFRRNVLNVLTCHKITTINAIHIPSPLLSLRLIWKEVSLKQKQARLLQNRESSRLVGVTLWGWTETKTIAAGLEFYIHIVLLVTYSLLKVQFWDLFFQPGLQWSSSQCNPSRRPESNTFIHLALSLSCFYNWLDVKRWSTQTLGSEYLALKLKQEVPLCDITKRCAVLLTDGIETWFLENL